jgi:hypothetical protein
MKTPPPLQIAKPCPKQWDDMQGDSKRRFCQHCQLHVHNLSAMSDRERDAFVASSGGRFCIAYVKRPDGSMVTPSLGPSMRRFFAPLRWGIASLIATIVPLGFLGCENRGALGKASSSSDKHQQKTLRATEEGDMLLGTPMVTQPKDGRE